MILSRSSSEKRRRGCQNSLSRQDALLYLVVLEANSAPGKAPPTFLSENYGLWRPYWGYHGIGGQGGYPESDLSPGCNFGI